MGGPGSGRRRGSGGGKKALGLRTIRTRKNTGSNTIKTKRQMGEYGRIGGSAFSRKRIAK